MKYLLLVIVAVSAVSCDGAKSSTSAAAPFPLSTQKPQEDSLRITAAKLFTMVAMDTTDQFDDKYRGREMVVLGEVSKAGNGIFYFSGDEGKEMGCQGANGETYNDLKSLIAARPGKKPVVEAIVKYNAGNHDTRTGETYISAENCSIISILE